MRVILPAMLGTTTAQAIGIAVVAAILVGWAVYLVMHLARTGGEPGSEIELAPNRRPYLNDEAMEGSRLDKVLLWSAVLVAVSAIGLPLYWLREPTRQTNTDDRYEEEAIGRGYIMFQPTNSPEHEGNIGFFGCGGCHGSVGQGGVTPFTATDYLGRTSQVEWRVPALDDILKKFSEEEVANVITYGRANTPMPAWGIEGGGPMNQQQVTDLVAYIRSIQISDEEAMERHAAAAAAEAQELGLSPDDGQVLFNVNCARCHTRGYAFGQPEETAGGAFGPSLRAGVTVRQFPAIDAMIDFVSTGSEFGQPYGVRGQGTGRMPGFGTVLTPEQIRAIVDYVRGLS